MKIFTLSFETIDSGAIIQAAAQMLLRAEIRDTLEEAQEVVNNDVDHALRLLIDQAVDEAVVGDLIEIHDSSCTDE